MYCCHTRARYRSTIRAHTHTRTRTQRFKSSKTRTGSVTSQLGSASSAHFATLSERSRGKGDVADIVVDADVVDDDDDDDDDVNESSRDGNRLSGLSLKFRV